MEKSKELFDETVDFLGKKLDEYYAEIEKLKSSKRVVRRLHKSGNIDDKNYETVYSYLKNECDELIKQRNLLEKTLYSMYGY